MGGMRSIPFLHAWTACLLCLPITATAQTVKIITNIGPQCDFKTGKLQASCIPFFIGHLVEQIFGIISVLFLINVMIAGYQLATGSLSGDKGKGKDRLLWSVIGLIVSACSFLILDLVLNIWFG